MSERTRSLLVTGGAGFVGSHFARVAAERGRRVVILDDLSGGPMPRIAGVATEVGDIGDGPGVRRVLGRHDVGAVIHFAGKIQVGESVRKPDLYFDVNLVRTLTLLDAVRKSEVPVVLFSSTAAVYGNPESVPIPETARLAPVNPYGASKLGVEHALAAYGAAYGLRWAALRYFNAAGAHPDGTMREAHDPETHLIPLVLDAGLGRTPPISVFGNDYDTVDGTCIRDYIHVMDLATAHLAALAALEAGREVGAVNLGTGRGYSVQEVIDLAATVVGRPIPTVQGGRRAGDPAKLVADAQRAERVLGWKAERSALHAIVEDALRARRGG